MNDRKQTMELNISAEDTEQHRRQNPSLSLQNRECQNDLNAPGRVESIDDNTKLPGYDNNSTIHNIPVHGRQCMRRGFRRTTLSIIEKELEEAKRLIDKKINKDNSVALRKKDNNRSNNLNENLDHRSSETETKTPYVPPDEARSALATRSEKVYARYVQEGDRNLMLIYEPKESKSEVYCKQIGNKNVMVHLNVSSNLCQLIDRENKGIIPLDSEGEVWLEIRRRSQTTPKADAHPSDVTSLFDNDCDDTSAYSRVQQNHAYVLTSFLTDSYVEGQVGRFEAFENSDICDTNDVNFYELEDEDNDGPYNTISVKERGDSLMIKFEKWNQHGVLNSDNLQESPILSHKKVIDFLRDKGNDFDVSICDWEYEKKESVYSYISSNIQFDLMPLTSSDYTEIPPAVQQFRQRPKEPIEHSGSFGQSFDHGYDSPLDIVPAENGKSQQKLYSKVDKNRTKCSATGNALDLPGCQQKGERSKDVKETHRSNSDPCARKDKIDEIYSRNPTCRNTQAEVQRKPEVPSRPPKRNLKPDLTEYKWYHGSIEKGIAKERLRGKEHGSFLVRDASGGRNADHQYTIEFIDENIVKKLMIMKTSSKYHFKEYEDKKFDRVEQLIYTIMTKGLQVKDSASDTWKNIRVKPVSYG